MADAIEVKLDMKADGAQIVDALVEKLKALEKQLGENTSSGAKKLRKEISELKKELNALTKESEKKFSVATFGKQIESLGKRINIASEEAKKGFSKWDVAASAAQGNTDAVFQSMLDGVEKTTFGIKSIATVGYTAIAGAAAFALVGIKSASSAISEVISTVIAQADEAYRKLSEINFGGPGQQVSGARAKTERLQRQREAIKSQREVSAGTESAKRANALMSQLAAIDMEARDSVLSTTNERTRQDIGVAAEKRKAEAQHNAALENFDAQIELKKSERKDIEKSVEDLKKELKKLDSAEAEAHDIQQSIIKREEQRYWMPNIIRKGVQKHRVGEKNDPEEYERQENTLKEIARRRNEIDSLLSDLKQQKDRTEQEFSMLQENRDKQIITTYYGQQEEFRKEDAERERKRRIEDQKAQYDLSETERRNREAEIENENAYLDSKSTNAEKKARIDAEILRHEKMMADEQKKFDDAAKGRDYKTRAKWEEEDQIQAEQARTRILEETDKIRQLKKEQKDAERQGDTDKVAADRTIQLEARKRMEDDIDALNRWNEKMGGELVGQANVNKMYSRRKGQYKKAQEEENRFVAEMRKKYGIGAGVNMQSAEAQARMTQAEKDRFANLHADTLDYRQQMRDAGFAKLGTEVERRGKVAEWMINSQQQGNRLTRMGLGSGGDGVDFSKSTAQNTKELVSLTKQMLREMGVDTKKMAADGWGI